MQKIRSFVAITLPDDIRLAAGTLIDRLSDSAAGIRWVETDTLHLTLKFLGDVDNREVMDVCRVLRKCCESVSPFPLRIHGAGAFPDLQRARVVWSGVDDMTGNLCELANKIDRDMAELGFRREPRDYRPHLTLGRLKKGSRIGESFAEAVQSKPIADNVLGTIQVDEICLYASYLEQGGPTYNVMDRVALSS